MSKHWVVVADKSKARIFSVTDPRGALVDEDELEHPQARAREQSLGTDRPGRGFDSKGQGRHAMGSSVGPDQQETIRFAKQIADHVLTAHNKGRCDRMLLVAGPSLLGLLREQFKTPSGLRITEIEKNLGQYDARKIREHLPERL